MLRDCHELDDIVTETRNTWQNVIGKFPIASNTMLLCSHPYVSFVNARGLDLAGRCILPQVFWFIDNLCGKSMGLFILDQKAGMGGNTIMSAILSDNVDLVEVTMFERSSRKANLPNTIV